MCFNCLAQEQCQRRGLSVAPLQFDWLFAKYAYATIAILARSLVGSQAP